MGNECDRFSAKVRFFSLSSREGQGGFLRPCRFGGERHEDRLDIAAGLEAEQRAAVVEQVELDIAAAPDELVAALLLGPRLQHVTADQSRVDPEKGLADGAGEGEIALPIAVEVVVED